MKMTKKDKNKDYCAPIGSKIACCKIEAIISVDERGQTVLPKEIREKANIRANDKLAAVSWEKDGKICCISLIKVEEFTESVKDLFGPIMKEMLEK